MLATDVGLMALFAFFRFICMNFLQELLSIDMKNDIFSKFIHFDLYFFEQYKSGELVSRLSSDINQAKSAVSNNLAFFIRSMVIVLITLIILFTISWKLALLVMLIMPMYLVITFQYSKRNKVLIRKIQDITA